MTQLDPPPRSDESPPSGERHSRERIARATWQEQVFRRAVANWDGLRALIVSEKKRDVIIRKVVAPVVLALVPLYWVVDATHRALLTTVGRDQGIFHYIAWAIGQGDIDYRDIRDVNGPLVHMLHMLSLKLGAWDEYRFHVLDHWATGLSFAVVGLLLPGISTKARPTVFERVAWAFAAWVVLAAQYAMYIYWNQAQRESFCDWFLLPSLALQIARPHEGGLDARRRSASRRIVLIAALSVITWFCKPSFLFFTLLQLGVVLIDNDLPLSRKARFLRFIVGGALGSLPPLAFLFRYGDLLAFLQITLRDVPQIYRFIWARSAPEILGDEGPLVSATTGLAASALLASLVALRALPRRMLALAGAPIVGVLVVVAQHKGFGYHFHPLTATTHMIALVIAVMLWERFRAASRARPLARFIALGVIAAYALSVASGMRSSPHTRNVWILAGGETPQARAEREWFDSFKTHDFFPWELREAANYLAAKTGPDARVQMYAMDPYLLFLARRRSATPYIYAYDLNADAALEGGWSNEPSWIEAERIRAARASHERDLLGRLKAAPPEAFVFVDNSPLISYQDAWEDFRHCCSETATWVATNYHPAKSFDVVHVWFRDDLQIADQETWPLPR